MTDIRQLLHEYAVDSVEALHQTLDAFVLSRFDSEEDYRKKAHLFVLEIEDLGFGEIVHDDGYLNDVTITSQTKYILRPKTKEELAAYYEQQALQTKDI